MKHTLKTFIDSLVFERDGDLNLTWLFVLLMGLIGSIGFLWTIMFNPSSSIVERIAAWSFLGSAFALVVLAAIPIAKTKILANSRVPGDVGRSIASVSRGMESSTDIQEMYTRTISTDNNNEEERG